MNELSTRNTRLVDTPLGALNLVDEGAGPPIVLVHGVPGTWRDFRHLTPHLLPWARVIRVDLPGFGGTPVSAGFRHDFAARAALIRAALDTLGVGPVVALGQSMGGGTAMALAADHPDRVRGVVTLCSIGPRRHRGMNQLRPWMFSTLAGALRTPGVRDLLLPQLRARWKQARMPGGDSMTAADFAFQLHLASRVDFPGIGRMVARITRPSLVIWSEDDHLVEAACSVALADALGTGQRLAFPTGGHNLQKTRAVEVADAVQQFILTLPTPGAD